MATINSSVNPVSPSPSSSYTPESSTSSLPPTTTTKPPAKSRPAPTSNEDGAAPRKRSRSDMTTEERKEARAHRNRIAAQNSRDKRKAQFSALEARIAELEAENRALRAGMVHPLSKVVDSPDQRAADAAREAENCALRERVQALETAWEAVIRTFQTHGTTAGLPTVLPPGQSSAPSPSPSTPASPSSPSPSTTTFPVLVPTAPVFSSDDVVFPLSPAASSVSLSTGGERLLFGGVPAAGEPMRTDEDLGALFGVVTDEAIDEAAMDDLFHEILAAPPTPPPSASTLMGNEAEVPRRDQGSADANTDADVGKEVEREIQRLFDLGPVAGTTLELTIDNLPPAPAEEGVSTALELDLGVWEAAIGLAQPVF
ncbi:hypothetical protein BJV74DRAFT_885767 [Russula compacta]|nr:hypothetical protein BJV74DRAFT_885767 [Russula compacta]